VWRSGDVWRDGGRWQFVPNFDGLTGSEWCTDQRRPRADEWRSNGAYAEPGIVTMPSSELCRVGVVLPILGRFEKCTLGIVFHLFDCAAWKRSALKGPSSLSRLATTDRDKPQQSCLRAHSCGVKVHRNITRVTPASCLKELVLAIGLCRETCTLKSRAGLFWLFFG
jgi:hypothetical protein